MKPFGSRFAVLMSSASFLAVAATGVANAQDAQAPAAQAAAPQSAAPQAVPAPSSDNQVVVVTARRRAMQNATERKKNSDTVIDSVVADEAGKLPDNSITEVLQRVAGVSMVRFDSLGDPDHFSAEGSGIQIRGLSGVAAFLNGREVFSANGGQGLLWGDVTPELMSSVDVYKDSTADRLTGGSGGAIDLRTKMPFDYKKPAIQASIGVSYGDLDNKTTPEGSLLLTKRWDTPVGEIGALVDLAYSKYSAHDNFVRVEPFYQTQVSGQTRYIPGGFDYGFDDFNRERTGVYAAFQWKPNDNLQFYTTFFSSKYKADNTAGGEFVAGTNFTVNPAGNNVFDSNGVLQKTDSLTTYNTSTGALSGAAFSVEGDAGRSNTDHTTTDWSTGFNWNPNARLNIKGAVQIVDSESHVKNYDIFPYVNFPGNFGVDLTGKLPNITLPASASAVFANPANYYVGADMTHLESNHGTMGAGNIDADYTVSDTGFIRDVLFGARYASRTERDDISGYNWLDVCQQWDGCGTTDANNVWTPGHTFANAPAADISSAGFKNFFRGRIDLPANLLTASNALVAQFDPAYIRQHYGTGSGTNQIALTPANFAHGVDRTLDAYVEARFAGDKSWFGVPYSGNFGVRFVSVDSRSYGDYSQTASTYLVNGVSTTLDGTYSTPMSGGRKTSAALPSLNVAFSPNAQWKIRFAANETMDLPPFSATAATGMASANTTAVVVNGATQQELSYYSTTSGNPDLKPSFSNNYDLSFEWYRSAGLSAHVALFHKDIRDLLIYGSDLLPTTIVLSDGTKQTVNAVASNVSNATKQATLNGAEFGVRQFFDGLPSPWNGLGYEATYTFIDSKNPGDTAYAIDNVQGLGNVNTHPLTDNPISGLSRDNLNLTGMYEKGPWSARIAYSWRSRYLMSTNSNGTNGTYTEYTFANGAATSATAMKISLPVYSAAYGQIDGSVSYKLNDNILLSLEGSNLSNAVARTLQGGYPGNELLPRSWFMTDRRVEFTVRLSY